MMKKTKKRSAPSTVKRFVVFSGDQFYANGGWGDYRSSHATLTAARRAPAPGDWWQIVDLATGNVFDDEAGRARQRLKLAAIAYVNGRQSASEYAIEGRRKRSSRRVA
jgi:hypothetical protein